MQKFLEGLEKLDNGLYRIRETIDVNYSNLIKVPITEEKVLVEGRETTPSKVGYRFKIWNSDPTEKGFNYNGRNYSKVVPLAIEQNLSTVSLMNHPDDEGDVRNICGVTKDSRLDDDGWMSCLFIPCGEYGKLVSDVIEAGGPISVSSSILGELDEQGFVTKENYILEREMDIVFGPSNGLNHYKNKVEYQNDDGSRDVLSEDSITENKKLTILDKDNDTTKLNEKKGETEMADKLVEASLKLNINAMVKDADKMENLYEKKDSLNTAFSYAKDLTDNSLANEIEEKIKVVDDELKVLSEKGLKTDELSESVKTLTESKDTLEKEVFGLKAERDKAEKQLKVITSLYEDKQYKAGETELNKNRKLAKEVCSLKLQLKEAEKTILSLKRQNRNLKEKAETFEAQSNTKVDADLIISLQEDVETLTNKNELLERKLRESRKQLLESQERQVHSRTRFEVAKRKLMENNRPRIKTTSTLVKPTITESRMATSLDVEDDEDSKMEKMLSHNLDK